MSLSANKASLILVEPRKTSFVEIPTEQPGTQIEHSYPSPREKIASVKFRIVVDASGSGINLGSKERTSRKNPKHYENV